MIVLGDMRDITRSTIEAMTGTAIILMLLKMKIAQLLL
jgi:hypothetical protein